MKHLILLVATILVYCLDIFAEYEDVSVYQPLKARTELKDVPDTVLISGKETLVYYSSVLDKQAEYTPDGMQGLMKFLSDNMKWSSSCYQPDGRVIAKCLITSEGRVERVEIIQSLAEYEDSEVLRLALMMTFTPAIMKDNPVASWFFLPIRFRNN